MSGLIAVLPAPRRAAAGAYIGGWIAAAFAAVALTAGVAPSAGRADPAEIALFLGVTAAAEAVILYLHHGRAKEFISLLEAAVCLNVLLFPPLLAVAVTVGGSAIAQVVHRRHPLKAAFNLAQYSVATVVAISLYRAVAGPATDLGGRTVAALAVGMVAFGLINLAAVSGIVSFFEARSWRRVFDEGLRLSLLTVLGNTSVGILAGVVWQTHPFLTVLFTAPAATLHLAYRGVVRTSELLEQVMADRDRLNRIVGGASDGIALLDAEGRVDVWSPAMTTLTGVAETEAAGSQLASVLTATTLEGRPVDPLGPTRGATTDRPTSAVEMMVAHRDGDTRVVKMGHTVLFDGDGRPVGDVVIAQDITREHESERLKDDFLARVSHELRTPLTPIKGYAQLLLRRGSKVSEAMMQETLSTIVERVDHMHALIEDLLLVSLIVAGRASIKDQIRSGPVDVADVCAKVVGSFEMVEPDRRILLSLEAEPIAIGDAARVEQIVTNLVSNACKYSMSEHPVDVVVRTEASWAVVDVVDHGRGIATHQLGKVFDRFYRGEDPLTMETGGIGLGLHISRELAVAMDGTVDVTSALGKGSTFTLKIPLARPPAGASPT